jgi:hypothetical protein
MHGVGSPAFEYIILSMYMQPFGGGIQLLIFRGMSLGWLVELYKR